MPTEYVIAPSCPEFENFSSVSTASARTEGKTAMAMYSLCRKHDLHPPSLGDAPPENRIGNISDGWTLARPCPRSHLAQSSKWAAYGNATATARYRGEPTSCAVLATKMLDLDACPMASFRNTLRPAPLVGAFARYLDRHLLDSDKIRDAASQYAIGAGRMTRGQDVFGTTPMAVLVRYVWGASTAGPEAKKAIYRATCAAIAAHVAGREIMTQADLAQAVRETADTEPIP